MLPFFVQFLASYRGTVLSCRWYLAFWMCCCRRIRSMCKFNCFPGSGFQSALDYFDSCLVRLCALCFVLCVVCCGFCVYSIFHCGVVLCCFFLLASLFVLQSLLVLVVSANRHS